MPTGYEHPKRDQPQGGQIGLSDAELGPLPDQILEDPTAGWLDPSGWFNEPGLPLEVEIGSGKGTFLVQEAARRQEANFLGIEWAGEFYRYAADRVGRHGLTNVRMLCVDATSFLRWRMPSAVVDVVHLYFPDPWPKSRHHKKRTVRDDVLETIHRVLVAGGELRVVTDHEGYWAWMESHWARWTSPDGWSMCGEPAGDGGPFERVEFERVDSADGEELVGTNFERKYRREGRPFFATVLRANKRL